MASKNIIGLLGCLAVLPAHAVTVQFDYRYDSGFFADEHRRDMLDLAASYYSGFIDELAAINPGQENNWSVWFSNPGNLSAGRVQSMDLHVSADTLLVYAGGTAMGSGVLGYADTGIIDQVSGSDDFVDAVNTRGQQNTSGPAASDYGIWGGSIAFNSDVNWHWGQTTDGLTAGNNDFLTTAIHELAHIFGFGTADSWIAQLQDGYFIGEQSIAAYGGPVPADLAHWEEGVYSDVNGVLQEALMDPSTPGGTRQLLTTLDYAGLEDIGWQVTPVPLPASVWLFSAALIGLLVPARLQRGAG